MNEGMRCRNLLDELKELYSEAKRLKLPGKQMKLLQTKSSLEKRMGELTDFLNAIVRNDQMKLNEHTVYFLKNEYVSIKRIYYCLLQTYCAIQGRTSHRHILLSKPAVKIPFSFQSHAQIILLCPFPIPDRIISGSPCDE